MNAALLLEHYEQIAAAPDAIARLRRFILDLAVRGKLVEQDPNDEPAAELLKRVSAEQARLENTGKIRKRERLAPVDPQDMPYGLPIDWQWVRFAQLANFYAGRTPARNDLSFWNTGEHAWVSIADMEDGGVITGTKETVSTAALKQVFKSEPEPVGTIIMSFKLTIGKIARLGVPAFHNEAIISIHPYLPALESYLFMALPELARAGNTKGAIKGATLNRDSLSNILVPLPPLAEQHRIVAKFEELMALCDQLEIAQTERETGRDQLTLSTFAKLNEPDPETFAADASFALEHLEPLTKRTDQIKQLRQTILNLAVRGKLVEQDPNDEPASELLKRIKAIAQNEQKRRGRTRDTSAGNALGEIPFEVPGGWTFASLGELVRVLNGRAYKQQELLDKGIPVLRVGNLFTSNHWYYSDIDLDDDKHCEAGDLIYAWSASFGPFIWKGPRVIYHYHIWKLPLISEADLDKHYLYNFLLQKTREIKEAGHGISMVHMTKEKMEKLVVPLPPVAEQRRIVAKVDELMAVCDQLEASLIDGQQTQSKLLEAVLHEALEPADAIAF